MAAAFYLLFSHFSLEEKWRKRSARFPRRIPLSAEPEKRLRKDRQIESMNAIRIFPFAWKLRRPCFLLQN